MSNYKLKKGEIFLYNNPDKYISIHDTIIYLNNINNGLLEFKNLYGEKETLSFEELLTNLSMKSLINLKDLISDLEYIGKPTYRTSPSLISGFKDYSYYYKTTGNFKKKIFENNHEHQMVMLYKGTKFPYIVLYNIIDRIKLSEEDRLTFLIGTGWFDKNWVYGKKLDPYEYDDKEKLQNTFKRYIKKYN